MLRRNPAPSPGLCGGRWGAPGLGCRPYERWRQTKSLHYQDPGIAAPRSMRTDNKSDRMPVPWSRHLLAEPRYRSLSKHLSSELRQGSVLGLVIKCWGGQPAIGATVPQPSIARINAEVWSGATLTEQESREPVNLDDPATRRALVACLALPYTGDPIVDERLDVIRAMAAGLEMVEKGRTERAAVRDLLARLDDAITVAETNVRNLGDRLVHLEARASAAAARH